MTTKELFRKQIIVPMSGDNINVIISQTNMHILNINRLLKTIKSNISADFICFDNKEVIITTNEMATTLDMNIMGKYIKELDNINSNDIMSSHLSQSKSYLKTFGVSYYSNNMFSFIIYRQIEEIIKETHLFNDVIFAS